MEVHHHPHPEKKSIKEYLLEGLMIFLAVMMGFIAENIREGIGDSEKGKEYVMGLVQNLKDDTTYISQVLDENNGKLSRLKKLMMLSHEDLSTHEIRKDLYQFSGNAIGYYSVFKSNDATMQQLKNSGGLRFIRKDHAADSIAKYLIQLEAIYSAEAVYLIATNTAINASHEVLDYSVHYDTTYYNSKGFTGNPLPLLTSDPYKLKIFFNKVDFELGATRMYVMNLERRKPFMISLLNFLKREYNLDKE